MNKLIAEGLATYIMVFCGTGAMISDVVYNGVIGVVGIGLVFGLVVMAMIYAVGHVSGAHINPAVTIAFWASGKLKRSLVAPYILAQTCGALLASFSWLLIMPELTTFGETLPTAGTLPSLTMEIIVSFILMFVILHVSTGAREEGIMAGIAIGLTVGLCAIFAGPISGASMNPARSLAPALVSGNVLDLWIYILGPIMGTLLAVPAWKMTRKN